MKRGAAALILALLAFAFWRAARSVTPAGIQGLKPEERAAIQLKTLEDILASKNDNDPRLDSDFEDLSPRAKSLFRAKYRELAPELRNERGTIVYILGKNPSSGEDWDFLAHAAAEPPCWSLADCSKKAKTAAEADDEVTLAYPALVALRQAQRMLQEPGKGGKDRKEALAVVKAGKGSKMPAVTRMAARIEQ